jgi:hypothetical protein
MGKSWITAKPVAPGLAFATPLTKSDTVAIADY